jgi:hypothetical protein
MSFGNLVDMPKVLTLYLPVYMKTIQEHMNSQKPQKMRPRTKHIALKYHHFREHVANGTIKINLIGTKDQIADIFTKALDKPTYLHLRRPLSGW